MGSSRQKYPLAFALASAALAVLCFQLVPEDVLLFGSGGNYNAAFLQAALAAVTLAALYFPSGGFRLAEEPGSGLPTRRMALAVLAAAFVLGAAKVMVQGSTRFVALPSDIAFAAMLLATAVFEELLFRGLLFEAFTRMYQRSQPARALLLAAVASSVLFGLVHITTDLGSLFRTTAYVQAAVKVAEAALFGICMCALYAKTRSIGPCVLVHFAFDLISEMPIFMVTGIQTSTYITGSPADIGVLVLATAVLAIPAAWAWSFLRHD